MSAKRRQWGRTTDFGGAPGGEAWESLAPYYDRFFPPGRPQLAFVQKVMADKLVPARRLLDVGCATGSFALALADAGFEVVGVDLSVEMVRLAQAKAAAWSRAKAAKRPGAAAAGAGPEPLFLVRDMLALDLPERPGFDGVICLGNTLAHMLSAAELGTALGEMASRVVPGGKAVLQTVNYDRLAATSEAAFPPVMAKGVGPLGEDLVLRRLYLSRADGLVSFVVTIQSAATGRTIVRTEALLRPVVREELAVVAGMAFHGRAEVYGDFLFSPWTVASPATVVVATREAE